MDTRHRQLSTAIRRHPMTTTTRAPRETTERIRESVLTTLLDMRGLDRPKLRRLGAMYRSLADARERSRPKLPDPTVGESFTAREKHIHTHGYGRGYAEGVDATLRTLCGADAAVMFDRWAMTGAGEEGTT